MNAACYYLSCTEQTSMGVICEEKEGSLSSFPFLMQYNGMLYCHLQAVAGAAVVARPSKKWGETPCAFVILKSAATDGHVATPPPPPTAAELIKHAKGFLDFKAPKTIIFVAELPMSALGKVQKLPLREEARAMGSAD
jgi:fatty-acyl-CoA synthase